MYTIYALTDPRTLLIRYVGMTQNHPVERMLQHWKNNEEQATFKTEWMSELKKVGEKPGVIILQHVAEMEEARDRERYWIKQGMANGWPLVNCADGAEKQRRLIQRRENNPLMRRPNPNPVVLKWKTVTAAFFTQHPELLTGPARCVVDLARAIAEADGGTKPYTAYKGIAHAYYHDYRRSHCDEPIPVDVSRPAGGEGGSDGVSGEN